MMLGWLFRWWPPLGRPVVLTLALSRRAGEGDALLWAGDFCEEGDGCCGKGRVLSEPRITLIAQMGCDFGVLWMVLVWGVWSTTASRSGKASRV